MKNIHPLLGKPLIAYSIAEARDSKALTACLVSTDSEEIAKVAEAEGGRAPFRRPVHLAGETSPTWQALQHAIGFYEEYSGERVHSVVTLQPTTPLRRAEDIDRAVELYLREQPEADCLVSVCKVEHMHPLTLYLQEGRWGQPLVVGANHTKRRQNWNQVLWRNGAVYISRRELIMEQERVVGDRPLCFEMPVSRSVSIDNLYDLRLAELHLQFQGWLEEGL